MCRSLLLHAHRMPHAYMCLSLMRITYQINHYDMLRTVLIVESMWRFLVIVCKHYGILHVSCTFARRNMYRTAPHAFTTVISSLCQMCFVSDMACHIGQHFMLCTIFNWCMDVVHCVVSVCIYQAFLDVSCTFTQCNVHLTRNYNMYIFMHVLFAVWQCRTLCHA